MRVLVVDDDRRVRRALRLFLEERGLAVVGEAESAEEVEPLLRRLRPDVLVLDWDLAGPAAARALADQSSARGLRVIALRTAPGGADGAGVAFVSKTDPPDCLTRALSAPPPPEPPADRAEPPRDLGPATWR